MECVKFLVEHGEDIIKRTNGKIASPSIAINECFDMWYSHGPAYTLIIDDVIICSAGVTCLGWNRGEAWMLVSSDFYQHTKTAYKVIKNMLGFIAREKGLKRVQSSIICDSYTEVRERFLKHLGFEKEGISRCAGPDNQDLISYARIF